MKVERSKEWWLKQAAAEDGFSVGAGVPEPLQYADGVIVTTNVRLGWLDRLRVLVHGSVSVWTQTDCEHTPGRTRMGGAHTTVPRVFKPKHSTGYTESDSPPPSPGA